MSKSYGSSAIVMLVAAGTVCENVREFMETFTTERPEIKEEFIDAFENDINDALKKYFGINSHTQVKAATQVVKKIAKIAVDDLGLFHVQLVGDFKNEKERRDFILSQLGFTKFWKKAQNKNQTALIELLLTLKNNLTTELRTEITAKGLNPTRITAVLAHAETLKQANITQESLKGVAKVQTASSNAAFNAIYDKAINLCSLGKKLFKNDKTKKAMFSFRALERVQIAAGVGDKEPATPKKTTTEKSQVA